MRRRKFLATSAGIPLLFNQLPNDLASSKMFSALSSEPDERVLVLIQLIGGNDGLNTLVPLDQYDNLAAVRPTIVLPENKLLDIGGDRALHPGMTGIRDIWDAGELAIIQDVSYPDQNRSHFRSSDIWHSGSESSEYLRTGWLGRSLDLDHPTFPSNYPNADFEDPIAITVGTTVSETCQGQASNFALTINNPFNATSILEGAGGVLPSTLRGPELDFLRTSVSQTNQYSATVKAKAEAGSSLVDYPEDSTLAKRLKYVAQMISGGLQTKVYVITLGGFDTHGDQVEGSDTSTGKHAELLKTLSEAVAAFQADIKALGLGERVIGMTYSEFGRRIRENGGLGTDHGTAAPMFMFGECVNAGVLGNNPTIDTAVDEQEGIAMQYDFRDIYGSVLEDWFGVEETVVRSVLHNGYIKLPVIRNCSEIISSVDASAFAKTQLTLAPSPFSDNAQLQFTTKSKGLVRMSVYDVNGSLVETLFERRLPAGEQTVNVNTSNYPKGVIIFHLQRGAEVKVVRGVKQ
ncbi:MAG: DUF1501 domain-containing protein [Saprospiraceae bacterium]